MQTLLNSWISSIIWTYAVFILPRHTCISAKLLAAMVSRIQESDLVVRELKNKMKHGDSEAQEWKPFSIDLVTRINDAEERTNEMLRFQHQLRDGAHRLELTISQGRGAEGVSLQHIEWMKNELANQFQRLREHGGEENLTFLKYVGKMLKYYERLGVVNMTHM